MTKWFCIAVILFFYFHDNVSSQWEWQNPIPQGNYLTDIFFVDTLNGWTTGYNGTILKTEDGGNTWQNIKTNIELPSLKIFFIDTQNGWMIPYGDNTFYKTTDGGISWHILSSLNKGYINDFYFVDNSLGFACGFANTLVRTKDGGITWEQLETPFPVHFEKVKFLNNKLGWVAGGNSIFKTSDSGINWNYYSIPNTSLSFKINDLYLIDSLSGYIAASDFFYDNPFGIFFYTNNGGDTWIKRYTDWIPSKIYFENEFNGFSIGGNGKIFRTLDGGISWTQKHDYCSNFFFINNKSWGIFHGSSIYKSEDSWETFIPQTKAATWDRLNSILIIDTSTVYVCGDKSIVQTIDGGKTWNEIFTSDSLVCLNSITKNNDEIWAVGRFGLVFYSRDKGVNWDHFKLSSNWLNDIYFKDYKNGFIVGTEKIFKTIDSGNNWDSLEHNLPAFEFRKIFFLSDSIGLLNSDIGIFKSSDGGNSWNLLKSGSYWGMDALGNSIWTISGNTVYFSNDLGKTWNKSDVYNMNGMEITRIRNIDFIDNNTGWVCNERGTVYKTIDGGFTWKAEEKLAGITLNDIKFYNESVGWSAGDGGSILRYSNYLTSLLNDSKVISKINFDLFTNYPNPFNPSTSISYSISQSSDVILEVYNLLGEKITTLVNEPKSSGSYEVTFEGRNLSSGIYIYRLSAYSFETGEKYFKAAKMLLLK